MVPITYSFLTDAFIACQKIAGNACIATIDQVEQLAVACGSHLCVSSSMEESPGPTVNGNVIAASTLSEGDILMPDKSGCEEIMKPQAVVLESLTPQLADFLDATDKLGILREFLPSVGAFSIGIFGLSRAGRRIAVFTFARTGFAGLALAGTLTACSLTFIGVGLFLFALSDVRRVLVRKVVGKIREQLTLQNFSQSHTDRIVRQSRRALSSSLYSFSSRFNRLLSARQQSLAGKETLRGAYRERSQFYLGLRGDADRLRCQVDTIEL